jgi:hypothetical protein
VRVELVLLRSVLDVCLVGCHGVRGILPLPLLLGAVEGALVFLRFADAALQRSDSDSTYLARDTYSVRAIVRPLEVHHAIEAGERCAVALVTVRVEFFLRENVSAALHHHQHEMAAGERDGTVSGRLDHLTSHEKDTILKMFVGGRTSVVLGCGSNCSGGCGKQDRGAAYRQVWSIGDTE